MLLSDVDICNELGRNIFVYPFNENNIRGNTMNLTASNRAWRLSDKTTAVNGEDEIIIPPHDTVLVETAEVLHVTQKIGGTYHSKVSIVSMGIGHIGTTLDPGWIGQSLIALHNPTDNPVGFKVTKSIVSVIFYYLHTEAQYTNTNPPGQSGELHSLGISLSREEREDLGAEWKHNADKLKRKMIASDDYKSICEKRKQNALFSSMLKTGGINVIVFVIFAVIVCSIIFVINYFLPNDQPNYYVLGMIALVSGAAVNLVPKIGRWLIDLMNLGGEKDGKR